MELSKECARRGEHYMGIWVEADSPDGFEYSDECIDSYQEALSFLDWACSVEIGSEAMARIVELRRQVSVLRKE